MLEAKIEKNNPLEENNYHKTSSKLSTKIKLYKKASLEQTALL